MALKVGAPKGGRVHWVLDRLPPEIKRNYNLNYDYARHNYRLYRRRKLTLVDEFLIVRTSKHCFRCIYFNEDINFLKYFSAKTSNELCDKILIVYRSLYEEIP